MIARVRAAEQAVGPDRAAAVVLAGREQVIVQRMQAAYPVAEARVTIVGPGYGNGYRQGTRADIGGTRPADSPAPASADGKPQLRHGRAMA